MNRSTYDIVIVGGGIIGSAAAFYLMKADNRLNLAVVERDPLYERASTTLSMTNARIQFSLKQNVQVSEYAFGVLEKFEKEMAVDGRAPHIQYRREGNLFIVDADSRAGAEKALNMQQKLGCRIEWWSPRRIKDRYPLYETTDIAGGTFGGRDGHFDAYAVLMAYKANAKSLGAAYVTDEVSDITIDKKRITGVKLASGDKLRSKFVINCAGAWAAQVAKTAGINLPVQPVKRQVFAVDPAVKPSAPLPLTILPSGLYFRTETGGRILLGKSMDDDPVGFDFTWDENRFTETLWPELAGFVPAFDTLKLIRGWAGLYAVNTLDGNAILGQWPEIRNLYLANGFSGHGLQQAPAVGRYLSELILEMPPALDLSIFNPERILSKKPIVETGLV